jgi:hypothetical protein
VTNTRVSVSLKEEGVILAHGCRLHCYRFVVRQSIMAAGVEKAASWQPGSRERERKREREVGEVPGENTPFKGMPSVTYFLQLGPTLNSSLNLRLEPSRSKYLLKPHLCTLLHQ